MNYKKENGNIVITDFTVHELNGLLKSNCEKNIIKDGNKVLHIKAISNDGVYATGDGYKSINDIVNDYVAGGVDSINIPIGDFKRIEPLIQILDKISKDVILKCSYIDYYNNIFIVSYGVYPDGGSNKVYYFEDNNTFIFFDENGVNIKTETKTSTFLDIVS